MIAVIFIHVSGSAAVDGVLLSEKLAGLIYGGWASWANLVFVMISGTFFLDPERMVTIQKLYSKNILRIVKVFCFWSAAYATCWAIVKHKTLSDWLGNFITGNYHMWFLFMLVGLYVMVPILRRITGREEDTRYFLLVAFFFTFLFPILLEFPLPYVTSFQDAYTKLHFYVIPVTTACFVGGYYLNHHSFTRKQRAVLYLIGCLGFIAVPARAALGSMGFMVRDTHPMLNAAFEPMQAVGVFTFGRYHLSKLRPSPFWKQAISTLSKYSLCIYMVHALVIEAFAELFGLNALSFTPVISIPILVCVVFLCSYAVAAVMHHIPFLKDHVV